MSGSTTVQGTVAVTVGAERVPPTGNSSPCTAGVDISVRASMVVVGLQQERVEAEEVHLVAGSLQ